MPFSLVRLSYFRALLLLSITTFPWHPLDVINCFYFSFFFFLVSDAIHSDPMKRQILGVLCHRVGEWKPQTKMAERKTLGT